MRLAPPGNTERKRVWLIAHVPPIARRISAVAVLTIIILLLGLTAIAVAQPAAISKAKNEADQLRGQVESLDNQLEQAREDAAYAQWQLEQTKAAIADREAKLTKAQEDLAVASDRFSERVDGIYRQGNVSFWEALFSADSVTDLFNRLDHLNRIGEQDGDLLQQITSYQTSVQAQKEELDQQKAKQKQLVADMEQAEARAADKLAERKQLLAGKEQEIARLEREEAERQERLAAERRAAAERAAQQAAAASQSSSGGSSGGSGSSSASEASQPSRAVPRSIKGGSAVDYAMSMIGVPYRWGGSSPSGFDCSGLMMWAYAQVGVSLPHSSRAQFGVGTPVSRSQLQPGDLVFFGSPIHHVGMYVGGGNMVHSPYTGSTVRVRGIDRSDYAGARRIL